MESGRRQKQRRVERDFPLPTLSVFLMTSFALLNIIRTRRIVYRLSDERQSNSLDGLISVCKNLQKRLLMFLFIKKVHISTESLLIDKHKTSDRLSNWFCLPLS